MALVGVAHAAPNEWTPLGLYGGNVTGIAADPSSADRAYALVNRFGSANVYRTADGGATWQETSEGIPASQSALAVAVDPATPTTIYLGLANGFAKSTDAGATWAATGTGLPPTAVSHLAIDPVTPATIYAAVNATVYKSTDGGATWSAPAAALAGGTIRSLAIDPGTPATLYAATNAGVYRSTDGAATWNATTTQPVANPATDPPPFVNLVGVAPATARLYAFPSSGRVYMSDDGGDTWFEPTVAPPSDGFRAIVFASAGIFVASGNNRVVASTDGGDTWTTAGLNADLDDRGVNALAVGAGDLLLAGTTGKGLYKSTDLGANWTLANTGIRNATVGALGFHPADDTLYAAMGGNGGAFARSTDGGATFTYADADLAGASLNRLAFDADVAGTVYTGGSFGFAGVFKTTDGGDTWVNLPKPGGVLNFVLWALASGDTTPTTLYAGHGPYRSTDDGATWTLVDNGLASTPPQLAQVEVIAVDPLTPTTVYASIPSIDDALYKTTDGGDTWNLANSGISATRVSIIAVDPQTPSNLLAGGNVIYRSTDSGASWTQVVAIPPRDIAFDPVDASHVLVAAGAIARSVDGGATFELFTGPPGSFGARGIAVDPTDPNRIIAAAPNIGLFAYELATDLAVAGGATANPIGIGAELTYDIGVSNAGPHATAATLQVVLPASATFVSATPSQGAPCTLDGVTVTCALGPLGAGGNAAVALVVTPTALGTLSATATVSGGLPDIDTANDSATFETQAVIDTDGDGTPDAEDTDDDGDGVDDVDDNCPLDANANQLDTDEDGDGNACDADDDGDGITDAVETAAGLDPLDAADAAGDLDGDGLTNLEEANLGTAIGDADTDGDGVTDPDEIARGRNPRFNEGVVAPLLDLVVE
ncbi:MAG: hypothetical protein H6983_01565 [Ectothiorhodospiraceae bacterium]|nr:hypothetical protein [Ectothiorhodospiraceae bacterium]